MKDLIKYKDYYYKIQQDDFCEDPNKWSDCILVSSHRDFTKYYFDVNGFKIKAEDVYSDLKYYEDRYYVIPIYVYSHSGVSLSFNGTCLFDSSQSAFVLMDKNKFSEDYTKQLEYFIDDWNYYLSGEVYEYIIYSAITCECCNNTEYKFYTSCSGIYGYDETVKEVEREIDSFYKNGKS